MIPPPCQLCAGACCEFIRMPMDIMDCEDDKRWLRLHAIPSAGSHIAYLPCPCTALVGGVCGIYPSRPACCKDFVIGGEGCREAIRVKRGEREKEIVKLL